MVLRLAAAAHTFSLPRMQALAAELVARAAEFAGDSRLPPSECLALRLSLIELLREESKRLAQVG